MFPSFAGALTCQQFVVDLYWANRESQNISPLRWQECGSNHAQTLHVSTFVPTFTTKKHQVYAICANIEHSGYSQID